MIYNFIHNFINKRLFVFLTIPFLTKFLNFFLLVPLFYLSTAESLGNYKLLTLVLGLLNTLCLLSFDKAILLEKKKDQIKKMIKLSLLLSLIVPFLFFLFYFFFKKIFDLNLIKFDYLWIILFLNIITISNIFKLNLLLKLKKIKNIFILELMRILILFLVSLILYKFNYTSFLIVGFFVTNFIIFFINFNIIKNYFYIKISDFISLKEIYKKKILYSQYDYKRNILSQINALIPFAFFFLSSKNYELGVFTFALTITTVPVAFFEYYYNFIISKNKNRNQLITEVNKGLFISIIFTLVYFIILKILVSSPLFQYFKWPTVEHYFNYCFFYLLLILTSLYFVKLSYLLKTQKVIYYTYLIILFFKLSILIISTYLKTEFTIFFILFLFLGYLNVIIYLILFKKNLFNIEMFYK